jgi:asparagine synthase (glutamine-hydrolysing)
MSVQFGRWNFGGLPAAPDYIENVRKALAPYGSDGSTSYFKGGLDLLYHAFHTTKESHMEIQPNVQESGVVISWDGRLDNRAEFIGLLRDSLSPDSADVLVVAKAYERWGTDSFAKLIGDWALSIWDPSERCVILARDFLGTRHLYYSLDENELTWSSVLDPLVLFSAKTFALEEEYIAGWLAALPATHLTPYVGIHSVPPSCFIRVDKGRHTLRRYWDFDPTKSIRYRSDGDYEEHFRAAFAQSVCRRLRSDGPILAELSGGMDSSSIVCVADTVLASGAVHTPQLDTVSYYDDSEPSWNERPYFTTVETKRRRTGCHIDVSLDGNFRLDFETDGFVTTPNLCGRPRKAAKRFTDRMVSQGNRILLSGIGGDEVTGGVPTPIPELSDLLATARLKSLAHQLKIWALNKRRPWFHLFFETLQSFFPSSLVGVPKHARPAPWLDPGFVKRNRTALLGYPRRASLLGPLPSFQDNLTTLDALRRQLECDALPRDPPYEKRYPYLDRNFLEFIYAIPREQLVRPGQRRSLMRRALIGIVPDQILNRKQKAFVVRAPMTAVSANWARVVVEMARMVSSSFGIVDRQKFLEALQNAGRGHAVPSVPLLRTLCLESWLRGLAKQNLVQPAQPVCRVRTFRPGDRVLQC